MKHSRYKELLIESAEGKISPEEKNLLEIHILQCAECRAESAVIAGGFLSLRKMKAEEVPDGYFDTIAPHVWKKIEAGGIVPHGAIFPLMVQRYLMPMAAMFVAAAMTGLFFLLQPSNSTQPAHLRSIISTAEKDELLALAEWNGSLTIVSHFETVIDALPNSAFLTLTLDHQFASGDIDYSSSIGQNVSAADLLDDFSEEEITTLLNNLNSSVTM